MVGEVGERGHQTGPLLGSERGGELLEALEPGLEDAAGDVAAAVGDADALHAPVGVVLAALEVAAAQQRVDRAAGARDGEPELLGDLLDGQLAAAVGEHAERLDVRHRELQLVEDREHRLALALHEEVPEAEQLAGEILRSRLRRGICCLHVCKYCRREDVFKSAIVSGAHTLADGPAMAAAAAAAAQRRVSVGVRASQAYCRSVRSAGQHRASPFAHSGWEIVSAAAAIRVVARESAWLRRTARRRLERVPSLEKTKTATVPAAPGMRTVTTASMRP